MTFRKYFCNPGLLKNEFKRTKYIMLLHTILLLLCTTLPAVLLNESAIRDGDSEFERIHTITETLIGSNVFMLMAIMVASFGTAYFLLSYMFKKKSVIFYGSMPEKKSCIFTTKFIAAVLSVLVPIAAVCAVNLAVSAALSVNEYAFILKHFAFLFSQYVFLIAAFSFAAALSGNFLSMLGTAGFGFLIYPLVVLAISGNISTWFKTYAAEYNIDIYYAFPPAMICGFGGGETKYIVFEAVLGAVLFALGIVFSTKRAAENAEKFFAFRFINAVIKYCAAVLIGLVIGCAIASIYTDNAVFSFVLYIIFAALAYIILQAIFEKSFKAMFSNLKHLAVFAVLFAALITIPIFDVLGLDFKVPDNPKSVTFAVTNNMDYLSYANWNQGETFTNPDIINAVLTLADENKAAAKERNYDPTTEDDDNAYCGSFSVRFDSSLFGMSRVFPYVTRDMMGKCFGKFYDTEDYKRALCAGIDKLDIRDKYGDDGCFDLQPECPYYTIGTFDKKFVDGFKKVLKADVQKYSYADVSNSHEFAYVNKFYDCSFSLVVYDCYEDTVNYLLENYFFVPATEMIELRNPANDKSVQITDINEMKSIFRVGRGYYEEIGENMCHIYAPSDSGEKTSDFVIVADAYIDDLPEKIAAKLR